MKTDIEKQMTTQVQKNWLKVLKSTQFLVLVKMLKEDANIDLKNDEIEGRIASTLYIQIATKNEKTEFNEHDINLAILNLKRDFRREVNRENDRKRVKITEKFEGYERKYETFKSLNYKVKKEDIIVSNAFKNVETKWNLQFLTSKLEKELSKEENCDLYVINKFKNNKQEIADYWNVSLATAYRRIDKLKKRVTIIMFSD